MKGWRREMESKIMFKKNNSCILIRDGKMYVVDIKHKDYYCKAITIMNGFQIELGRSIKEIKTALKETRLPIILKEVININEVKHYQVVRMHTGNVDDKVIATIVCKKDIISIVSFNKALIKDKEYRKYNQISILHQLSIPYSLAGTGFISRNEQIKNILGVAMHLRCNIKVTEEATGNLQAIIEEDEPKIKILFILNEKTQRYELTSLALV